jgi:hypothetical protein
MGMRNILELLNFLWKTVGNPTIGTSAFASAFLSGGLAIAWMILAANQINCQDTPIIPTKRNGERIR